MRKKRQYIATALALAMVCNSVPVGVFADTQSGVSQIKVVQNEDTSSQATDEVLESDSSSSELDTTEVNESDIESTEDVEIATGSAVALSEGSGGIVDFGATDQAVPEDTQPESAQTWQAGDCKIVLSGDKQVFTVTGTGESVFNPNSVFGLASDFPWGEAGG